MAGDQYTYLKVTLEDSQIEALREHINHRIVEESVRLAVQHEEILDKLRRMDAARAARRWEQSLLAWLLGAVMGACACAFWGWGR